MTAVDNLYPSQWRVPMMTLPEFSETISKVCCACVSVGREGRVGYVGMCVWMRVFSVGAAEPTPFRPPSRPPFPPHPHPHTHLCNTHTLLKQVPLLHQPGTTWRYSYGYDLLGVLLAKVTGQSPDLWMKQVGD